MKRNFTILLALIMMLSLTMSASAKEDISAYDDLSTANIDLNEMDLSKPFSTTTKFVDENGDSAEVTLTYEPADGSKSTAVVGTWTTSYTCVMWWMSYKYDLEKDGTHWEITNERSHVFGGILTSFSNDDLDIKRAVSTPTFDAEVEGSVTVTFFDNQWIPLMSNNFILLTTISDDGVVDWDLY